jgi:zinc protease
LFELLYLNFTDPRIYPEIVPVIIDEYRTVLAQRSQNPEAVFFDEIKKITYNNNPRFMPLTVDDILKIDAEAALAFIKKCLNPADYTFVITGNIDREIMSSLVETYIASIPASASFNQWSSPSPPVVRPGKIDTVLRSGKEEKGYVYSGRFIAMPFDESTAMICNVLSEYLDIILVESIREKLGGAYMIGASVSLSPVPPDGELCFEIYFVCDPKRAVELNTAVEAELAKVASGSINADTFGKAQKALVKNWEQSMQSNSYLSRTLANYAVIFNIPTEHLFKRPATYEALRQIDMQNLMKQILQRGPVTIMMYPAE